MIIHSGPCNGPPCGLCELAETNPMLRAHWLRQKGLVSAELERLIPPKTRRSRPSAKPKAARGMSQARAVEPPIYGPGTELKVIIEQFGKLPSGGCGCEDKIALMNRWGINGCRAQRLQIAAWLREGAQNYVGTAFTVDSPVEEFLPLVDEAIRLADLKINPNQPMPPEQGPQPLKWTYGVTATAKRKDDLLPRTLKSLAVAGFDKPRLFVDGIGHREAVWFEERFGLEVTCRHPTIRTFGNWVLALAELYIREPAADRYAIFQDDMVAYPGLRRYLECCAYPDPGSEHFDKPGYLNLYTMPSNQGLSPGPFGFYPSAQTGRGAVALVFSRLAVTVLLTHQHMVERPQDPARGWRAVDGGIVESFKKAGWLEYVHDPSLVQHVGLVSSMGNKPHLQATSFRGEDFDAMELIRERMMAPP